MHCEQEKGSSGWPRLDHAEAAPRFAGVAWCKPGYGRESIVSIQISTQRQSFGMKTRVKVSGVVKRVEEGAAFVARAQASRPDAKKGGGPSPAGRPRRPMLDSMKRPA